MWNPKRLFCHVVVSNHLLTNFTSYPQIAHERKAEQHRNRTLEDIKYMAEEYPEMRWPYLSKRGKVHAQVCKALMAGRRTSFYRLPEFHVDASAMCLTSSQRSCCEFYACIDAASSET